MGLFSPLSDEIVGVAIGFGFGIEIEIGIETLGSFDPDTAADPDAEGFFSQFDLLKTGLWA